MVLFALRLIVRRFAVIGVLGLLAVSPLHAQSGNAQDALGVPGPISFEGKEYALAWAAQPSPGYYKQEYLVAGQQHSTYTDLFMIEAVTGAVKIQDAVAAQIRKLEQRKGQDPVVNYSVIRNDKTGEIILDFLMSDSRSDNLIIEWNAYRYKTFDNGIALFAISRRGYGDQAKPFIAGLKNWRAKTLSALGQYSAPSISPRK